MMKVLKLIFFTLTLLALSFISCKKENVDSLDCSTIHARYTTDIAPILNTHCLSSGCHNAGSTYGDLTNYTNVKMVVNDGSFESKVIKDKSMPPSQTLSTDELNKIKCWISSGYPNN